MITRLVIIAVKFYCTAVTQGVCHVII